MDQTGPEKIDEEFQSETPEDVAVLYSWAKLQGAKYRDFSASRREYRAQMRHRAAESQREAERLAQVAAEAAAAETEKAAREAEQSARAHDTAAREAAGAAHVDESAAEEAASARALQTAAELARKASAERVEAARRAEAVAAAEAAARREELEMAEAHASAERQAQRYREAEVRIKPVDAEPLVAGKMTDPYDPFVANVPRRRKTDREPQIIADEDMQPSRHRASRDRTSVVPAKSPYAVEQTRRDELRVAELRQQQTRLERARAEQIAVEAQRGSELPPVSPRKQDPVGRSATDGATEPAKRTRSEGEREAYAARVAAMPLAARLSSGSVRIPAAFQPEALAGSRPTYESRAEPRSTGSSGAKAEAQPDQRADSRLEVRPPTPVSDASVPAWISGPTQEPMLKRNSVPAAAVTPRMDDTLQQSRERVASRWFALKGVFDPSAASVATEAQPHRAQDVRVPLLTVYSQAGGVGKTSLVATLGRALSSEGERVLLADTTSHGLLPFYFGASDLRPGVVRTFSPPEGSADAPIYMVGYDLQEQSGDAAQERLGEELTRTSANMQRVLVDLTPGTAWVARRLARMNSTMLVPVAPDMNSVISLQNVERFFASMTDSEGQPVRPFYVLNQFDAALPLHLDVREVMRQQLGDRLLPFAIRRSTAVSEALAEGMTVMDYAPESTVAGDYGNLVAWLRKHAVPAAMASRNARWSER